jgi:endonuclease-3
VVDTHVQRITQRLGWTKETTPEKIEPDLMRIFPRRDWDMLSHVLIFHGRRICFARKPACATCPVSDVCPCAFKAEMVGRKAGRAPRVAVKLARGRGAAKKAKPSRAVKSKHRGRKPGR